ncbi:MAG: hypothetical protein ACM31D_05850 [Bacteroidota bacterium]
MNAPGMAEVARGEWRTGLVLFADATDLWWLRWLRPGFRHCFVALAFEGGWVVIDPMSHRTGVAHFPLPQEFDLAGWYRQCGLVVVPVQNISLDKGVAPFLPYSCVECVKRILGIRARSVVTPWQLFQHLNKSRTFPLTSERS